MNESPVVALLRRNDAFGVASDEALASFAAGGTETEFEAGVEILTEGVISEVVWVLGEGTLSIFSEGREINRVSEPGELVGEIGAVSSTPASATVRTASRVRAISFPVRTLHRTMEKSPPLAASLLRSMAKYLSRA